MDREGCVTVEVATVDAADDETVGAVGLGVKMDR